MIRTAELYINQLSKLSIADHFLIGVVLAIVLTTISYSVGLTFGWFETFNYLEVFAVMTSYLCTYLCVVQSRWNYPIGIITTCAYAILFFQWNLIGSAMVNLYLMFQLVYGWFRWGKDENTLPVTRLKLDWWLAGYVGVTAATYMVAYLIITYFGGSLVPADAFILIGTILAQFLLDNKKIDTWKVWFCINVAAIWVYSGTGLYLVAFQYVFFLMNTFLGYAMWRNSMNR